MYYRIRLPLETPSSPAHKDAYLSTEPIRTLRKDAFYLEKGCNMEDETHVS